MPINCEQISLDNLCVVVDSRKAVSFRTVQQQYGDGYTARRQDGINPVTCTWTVSTPPMPVSDVQDLEAELIANGTGFFTWTPPNETEPKNWILDPVAWDWSYQNGDMAALSFSLRQWYGA